ncbi:hypothetical protein VTI74DRAFT_9551 [Chaetomium olivicolor]
MDPGVLKGVLTLATKPVLRPARVYGHELTSWGQYKALVKSKPGTVVQGRAYMVRSVEEEYRLAYYETNAYSLATCAMYFTDGPGGEEDEEPTFGKTFKYAGDAQALKRGVFDRTLWEMQMGMRLPPRWRTADVEEIEGVELEQEKGTAERTAEEGTEGSG